MTQFCKLRSDNKWSLLAKMVAPWDEGRICNLSQYDVCFLAVTEMTDFRNMFACRHDGVETLNFFLRCLKLDICRWLRCSGCGEICTRDHNLSGIDRVKKAKRISHVEILRFLTVSRYSFCKGNVSCTSYSRTFGYGILT